MNTTDIEQFHKTFDHLIPPLGRADTLAGEIARAVTHLAGRFQAGERVGTGSGLHTCCPAARFLMIKLPNPLGSLATSLWQEEAYEEHLNDLIRETGKFLKTAGWEKIPNRDDFLSHPNW